MYQGACTVHCRLNRNSQSRQFIHQQWLTEQLPILMKVSSCHICVSINNKDHDLGNARLLVPNRCVQLPEAISSHCCPLRFAPWWFLKVSPQLLHYVLQNLSFLIMNFYFLLSSFKMKITTNTQIIKHGTFILIQHLGLPSCFIFSKPPRAERQKSLNIYLL